MTSLSTKIKTLDTKILTNTQNISNKQNILTPGTNISIDGNNTISSSGGISQSQLDTKQNILQAGENITISNNIISSTGGITQSQLTTALNKKQDNLDIYDNIILNSLFVSPFSTKTIANPAENGEIRSKILSIEDDDGIINVGDTINSMLSTLENKQSTLTAGTNISIDNNIISASNSINQSQLDLKQDILQAGTNISILKNVISSNGGGGAGITQEQLTTA
jgi:pectate lyase